MNATPIINKIFDGLYIGNQTSVYDSQTISLNFIHHLIITSTPPSLEYFQHLHQHHQYQQLLPFVERAYNLGECCLIYGQDLKKPAEVAGGFVMLKFKWSLFKTLEYINWRVPGVDVDVQPLKALQLKMIKQGQIITYNWDKYEGIGSEELIIRNTFINGRPINMNYDKVIGYRCGRSSSRKGGKRVSWMKVEQSKSPKKMSSSKNIRRKNFITDLQLKPSQSQTEATKQKIVLSVMEIVNKGRTKGLNKNNKFNQSKVRLPTLQEIEQEKSKGQTCLHRSKTEVEDIEEEKENLHTETVETKRYEKEMSEKSFKRTLVEETVKKLKLMKDSTKVMKKPEASLPKRQTFFNQ